MAKHPSWTRRFLSEADLDAVTRAIKTAEARTSAEIRVHLERRVPRRLLLGRAPDVLTRARHVFQRLGMHRTAERHGVLIYLAVEDRRFAVVGDEGIHGRVGDLHWHRVRDLMGDKLRAKAPREAIERAVEELGQALAEHYPRRPDDQNELSDEVSVT
ncbi:MAG: TPM domain-containing protein [Candidatus Rokuibacteriota bacterium]